MLLRNLVLSAISMIKTHYGSGPDVNVPSGSVAHPATPQYNPIPRPHIASLSSHSQANKFLASQNAIYGRPVGSQYPGHGATNGGPITFDSRFSNASAFTNGAASLPANQVPAGQRKRHSAGNLGSYVVMDDGSHQFLKGGGYIPGSS
jgi:hypothetical protein